MEDVDSPIHSSCKCTGECTCLHETVETEGKEQSQFDILTLNVNSLRRREPIDQWPSEYKTDVMCLQETRISKNNLNRDLAVTEGYQSPCLRCSKRKGYSGTATYCKDSLSIIKQEDIDDICPDAEGRCLITHHKIRTKEDKIINLAIINMYVPCVIKKNEANRFEFQKKILSSVQQKCKDLRAKNINVIIAGDLNMKRPEDDKRAKNRNEAFHKFQKQWLDEMLEVSPKTGKCLFVDAFRKHHPNDDNAFTCWHLNGIKYRTNQHGSRIDYILVDTDLAEYSVDCVILSNKCKKSSDHCPVKLTLNCTPISLKDRPKLFTKDEIEMINNTIEENRYVEKEKELAIKRKRGRPRKIEDEQNKEPAIKRKRGRPRKIEDEQNKEPAIKRKRGRPRKIEDEQNKEPAIKRMRGRPRKIEDEQNKEPAIKRKRGRPRKIEDEQNKEPAIKRKRGRPRKIEDEQNKEPAIKRKRGRPRKIEDEQNKEPAIKRMRGRPRKIEDEQNKEPAIKRKRGRPRKIEDEQNKEPAIKRKRGRPRKIEDEQKKEPANDDESDKIPANLKEEIDKS